MLMLTENGELNCFVVLKICLIGYARISDFEQNLVNAAKLLQGENYFLSKPLYTLSAYWEMKNTTLQK